MILFHIDVQVFPPHHLHRAVDKYGKTLDFMLSDLTYRPAAARFFAKAMSSNGFPSKIAIEKSGANMIRKKQIYSDTTSGFRMFAEIAG